MRVSQKRIELQANRISKLSQSAAKAMERALAEASSEWEAVEIVTELGAAYSKMSEAVTAQFYNDIRREAKLKSRYTAVVSESFNRDKAVAATIAITNEFYAGTATKPLPKLLGDYVGRVIKNAADYCIRWNARRDPAKPRYAIVPNGDACAFCVMRASLGYTYPTADSVESHAHCTCTATPVFGDMKIQGYDYKQYEDKYIEAAKAYDSGDLSEDTKQRIETAKERHDARYAAGKTEERWGRANAVLIVMREQQGIK